MPGTTYRVYEQNNSRTVQCMPSPEASWSCSSTRSRLNDAGFCLGGNSINDWICCATYACAGTIMKAWSITQSQ